MENWSVLPNNRFSNDLAFYPNQSFAQSNNLSRDINDLYGTNLQAALDLVKTLRLKAGTFIKQDRHKREDMATATQQEQESLTTDFFAEAEYAPVSNQDSQFHQAKRGGSWIP